MPLDILLAYSIVYQVYLEIDYNYNAAGYVDSKNNHVKSFPVLCKNVHYAVA